MDTFVRNGRKVVIGVVGGLVLLIGLVLVPYPGPGWLIVFSGLAILSTEFHFAKRLLAYGRQAYDRWSDWMKRQPWYVQAIALLATGAVVLVTLWLLNTFALLAGLVGIEGYEWLISPFFR